MTKVTNYAANDRAISEYEYEYDLSGAITKETSIVEGKKTVREFEYDAVGSLHSETVSAGKSTCKYTYEYDHSGNRTKVTSDENGKKSTVTYQYDNADRLTKTSDSVNGNTLFTYDANGNRASKTGSDGVKYTYEYDTENRLRAVKDNGTLLMAALYDGNGDRVFTVNRSTRNYTETTSQPGVNSPTGPTHGADSSDNTANAGLNGQPQGTMYLYAYDDKLPVDPADTIFWYGFGQGMINSITVASAHLSVWFNEMWETITEHFELFARRLGELGILGSEEKEYSYDYKGAKPSQQLQDQMNLYQTMLIPYGFSDKTEEDYELLLYVNDVNRGYTETLATYGTDGYVNTVYTYGNERLISEQFGKSSYYTYNGRGDVSSLLSDAGVPQVNYSYDAYGNYTATAVSDNPYGYNAEVFDCATGLQYLRARYYDSTIGAFITQDTYKGTLTNPATLNLYDYVGNDPINHTDPSGHSWISNALSTVKNTVNNAYNSAKNKVGNVLNKTKKTVTTLWSDTKNLAQNALNTGKNMADSAINKISNVFSTIGTTVSSVVKKDSYIKKLTQKAGSHSYKRDCNALGLTKLKTGSYTSSAAVRQKLSVDLATSNVQWYDSLISGLIGVGMGLAQDIASGFAMPYLLLSDYLFGTDYSNSFQTMLSNAEEALLDQSVKDETWYYGGKLVGHGISLIYGISQMISGLETMAGSIVVSGAGIAATATGVGVPVGGVAISVSVGALVAGAAIAVAGAGTVVYAVGNAGSDLENFNNSLKKSSSVNYEYREGLVEVPDEWNLIEYNEEHIKSDAFKEFLRSKGKNPKKWNKVMEKWGTPDGTIYQRHYWTDGNEYYYHGEGIEEFHPH